MFRNQYDSDVTIWSPDGRLLQVEYASEAMKQGSATVGVRSKTHAVLVALKRAPNELCSYQEKIIEIDTNVGLSMAGLLADGRLLAKFLQQECSKFRNDYTDASPIPVLTKALFTRLQSNTQIYGGRAFGVGLIIAGYDVGYKEAGPHVVYADPEANVEEMYAVAIGAKSQAAETYMEKFFGEDKAWKLADVPLDKLVEHALIALRETLSAEDNLTEENTSIGIVGRQQAFKVLQDTEVAQCLQRIANVPRSSQRGGAAAEAPEQPAEE